MLLAVDVGNTNTVFGLFRGETLEHSFRLQSDIHGTVDEYALQILTLLGHFGVAPTAIRQVIVGSVVPALSRVFSKLSQKYFAQDAHLVSTESMPWFEIRCDHPKAVGVDRLVGALAAREMFGAPVVVVDLGTATTFDVVGADGAYEGGMIAPGILLSSQALFEKAAMLQSIELREPQVLIGKNTRDALLSGIIYGYVSLVDGMIERLRESIGPQLKAVATGGLAHMIALESKYVRETQPDLTLSGLRLIAARNGYR